MPGCFRPFAAIPEGCLFSFSDTILHGSTLWVIVYSITELGPTLLLRDVYLDPKSFAGRTVRFMLIPTAMACRLTLAF